MPEIDVHAYFKLDRAFKDKWSAKVARDSPSFIRVKTIICLTLGPRVSAIHFSSIDITIPACRNCLKLSLSTWVSQWQSGGCPFCARSRQLKLTNGVVEARGPEVVQAKPKGFPFVELIVELVNVARDSNIALRRVGKSLNLHHWNIIPFFHGSKIKTTVRMPGFCVVA